MSNMDDSTSTSTPVHGSAFNQGAVPTIAVFNKATMPLGVDLSALVVAMQVYIDQHIVPVWASPAKLQPTIGFVPNAWAMVFLDDADQAGALAYHDLTPDGLPVAKVFVRTTLANHDLVSVSASHELVEMLVDPAINLMSTGPDPRVMYAYESADPVENGSFLINGIAMSNFVFPSYFETFHKPKSVPFDAMGIVTAPFAVAAGGYQIVYRNGRWANVFGSTEKAKAFKNEDRRGHRGETRRTMHRGHKLQHSTARG